MAKFVVSVGLDGDSEILSNLPDIVLVGPSNSGKSSLINALSKSKIALVSNKPGKTKTLNFYDFEDYYLVDTPGYGYAKGSKSTRESFFRTLENYFFGNRSIVGALQIVASRNLSNKDLEVSKYLKNRFYNYILVVNKTDMLSNNKSKTLFNEIVRDSGLNHSSVVMISAKSGLNLSSIRQKIKDFLE